MIRIRQVIPVLAMCTSIGVVCSDALAGEPDPSYAMQLRRGFEACEAGDFGRYFSQKDFAFKGDASLRTYAGKIEKYDVQPTLARCDREMAQKRDVETKRSTMEKLFEKVDAACWNAATSDEGVDAYKAARAAFVGANGGSTSFDLGERYGNTGPRIAKCDKDVESGIATRKRVAEEMKKAREKAEQEAAARKAKADAEEKKRKAIVASLKGDRAALFRERGQPAAPRLEDLARAAAWKYEDTVGLSSTQVGDATAETTTWCNVVFEFKGDKKTGVKRNGPGCKYDR